MCYARPYLHPVVHSLTSVASIRTKRVLRNGDQETTLCDRHRCGEHVCRRTIKSPELLGILSILGRFGRIIPSTTQMGQHCRSTPPTILYPCRTPNYSIYDHPRVRTTEGLSGCRWCLLRSTLL